MFAPLWRDLNWRVVICVESSFRIAGGFGKRAGVGVVGFVILNLSCGFEFLGGSGIWGRKVWVVEGKGVQRFGLVKAGVGVEDRSEVKRIAE